MKTAAERLGVTLDTAARAFRDLQAKGFIVVTKPARLGVDGKASSPELEITELALPHNDRPRKLYLEWRDGADFTVITAVAHNPRGANGRKQKPVTKIVMMPSRKP